MRSPASAHFEVLRDQRIEDLDAEGHRLQERFVRVCTKMVDIGYVFDDIGNTRSFGTCTYMLLRRGLAAIEREIDKYDKKVRLLQDITNQIIGPPPRTRKSAVPGEQPVPDLGSNENLSSPKLDHVPSTALPSPTPIPQGDKEKHTHFCDETTPPTEKSQLYPDRSASSLERRDSAAFQEEINETASENEPHETSLHEMVVFSGNKVYQFLRSHWQSKGVSFLQNDCDPAPESSSWGKLREELRKKLDTIESTSEKDILEQTSEQNIQEQTSSHDVPNAESLQNQPLISPASPQENITPVRPPRPVAEELNKTYDKFQALCDAKTEFINRQSKVLEEEKLEFGALKERLKDKDEDPTKLRVLMREKAKEIASMMMKLEEDRCVRDEFFKMLADMRRATAARDNLQKAKAALVSKEHTGKGKGKEKVDSLGEDAAKESPTEEGTTKLSPAEEALRNFLTLDDAKKSPVVLEEIEKVLAAEAIKKAFAELDRQNGILADQVVSVLDKEIADKMMDGSISNELSEADKQLCSLDGLSNKQRKALNRKSGKARRR
ncbi:hypothetical protein IQ07DRAFT_22447 [Pyrenochaeta sp. DS3sAY3a]|nr:hypothetical protein IQ07DRAFT_22447 [Pyrenochaeta sp. DS3sAY3a]